MSEQILEKPIWEQHKARFGEEYICLKCHRIVDKKTENCPTCNGVMCVRIKANN